MTLMTGLSDRLPKGDGAGQQQVVMNFHNNINNYIDAKNLSMSNNGLLNSFNGAGGQGGETGINTCLNHF